MGVTVVGKAVIACGSEVSRAVLESVPVLRTWVVGDAGESRHRMCDVGSVYSRDPGHATDAGRKWLVRHEVPVFVAVGSYFGAVSVVDQCFGRYWC